jgi:Uma2 family endonuclease
MAIEQLLTVTDYDDYVRSLPPDAPVPELINGRLVVAARPTRHHAYYLSELLIAINGYIKEHQYPGYIYPEFEVVLEEHAVIVPDLAYIVEDNPQGRLTDQRLYGAPDEEDKYLAYLRAGVREYWLVDPDRPAGDRFRLFERVEQDTASGKPTFRRIQGKPDASRLFPDITLPEKLL